MPKPRADGDAYRDMIVPVRNPKAMELAYDRPVTFRDLRRIAHEAAWLMDPLTDRQSRRLPETLLEQLLHAVVFQAEKDLE